MFLARALVQDGEIYFMDEPFKGVDKKTEETIITILKEMKNKGKTVVVVHHDLNTVRSYFDWVTLLNVRTVACGKTTEVFTAASLKEAYNLQEVVL